MASKTLSSVTDLNDYLENQGYIRKFRNSAVKETHLLYCIQGTNAFGTLSEVASVQLTEAQFATLEATYPMRLENHLMCSEYFPVAKAVELIQANSE